MRSGTRAWCAEMPRSRTVRRGCACTMHHSRCPPCRWPRGIVAPRSHSSAHSVSLLPQNRRCRTFPSTRCRSSDPRRRRCRARRGHKCGRRTRRCRSPGTVTATVRLAFRADEPDRADAVAESVSTTGAAARPLADAVVAPGARAVAVRVVRAVLADSYRLTHEPPTTPAPQPTSQNSSFAQLPSALRRCALSAVGIGRALATDERDGSQRAMTVDHAVAAPRLAMRVAVVVRDEIAVVALLADRSRDREPHHRRSAPLCRATYSRRDCCGCRRRSLHRDPCCHRGSYFR